MTTYWRNSFWRTSVNGVLHKVEGHSVDRDSWNRTEPPGLARLHFADRLEQVRAGRSVSATFVNPNAECPVCGAQVFFYQNALGSRVYFDELGPPWPKHPCMADSGHTDQRGAPAESIIPEARLVDDADSISRWLKHAEVDPLAEFHAKYQLSPWEACRVDGTLKHARRRVLVLCRLSAPSEESRQLYVRIDRSLKSLLPGDVVFFFKGWVSYVDRDSLQHVELEAERMSGAKAAINWLLTSADA